MSGLNPAQLRTLRTQAGLSQRATARAAGLSLSAYQCIESGRYKSSASIATALKLAGLYAVPVETILDTNAKEC